jgi:hypothetical protein
MNAKDILKLWEECDGELDKTTPLSLEEEGEWTQDYKYQNLTTIVKHVETDTFWAIHQSRSGSYHTDWYYNDPDCNQVKPVEETITIVKWVDVK